ncbi:MAG: hypothetical protein WDW36_006431 [Sanguina aurantia]
MQLAERAGSGVGFVATRDVREGEVLLVSPPLFPPLSGPNRTQPPSGLELAHHVQALQPGFSSETQRWLRLLRGGDADSDSEGGGAPLLQGPRQSPSRQPDGGGAAAGVQRLSRLRQLLPASSEDGGGEGGVSVWEVEVLPSLDWAAITAAVNFNSYADIGEDAAVVACRGGGVTQSRSFAGMWGSFSLLNHSCAPNASHLVVDQQMVVHAAHPISSGEEMSINYFGARVLQPVEERRKYLRDSYGFECRCPRCTFESSLPAAARGQVAGSANTAGMMAEVLGEGGRRGDAGIEGEVVAVLGNYQDEIRKLGDRLGVTEQQRSWIQASTYPIYEGVLKLRTLALQQQMMHSQQNPLPAVPHSEPSRRASSSLSAQRATTDAVSNGDASSASRDLERDNDSGSSCSPPADKPVDSHSQAHTTNKQDDAEPEEGREEQQDTEDGSESPTPTSRPKTAVYRKAKRRLHLSTATSAAARSKGKARALFLRAVSEELEAIDVALEAVASVARGSDLHVSLSERRLAAAESVFGGLGSPGGGGGSGALMEAERSCYDAWVTRYGQLSYGGYTRLLAAKRAVRV